jgi:predicted transcriptional regulator
MNIRPFWKDVFSSGNDNTLKEHFNSLGQEFFTLYKALNENPSIQFCLTDEQQTQFNAFFTQVQEKYLTLQGMDYMATIRRLGLIAFRIAMIFTALRIPETGDFSEKQFCSDTDFQNTLAMIRILVRHSSHVFSELPVDITPTKPKDRKEQFLEMLPVQFNCQDFIELAKRLSIAERTAFKYIATFCEKGLIFKEQQGTYTKTDNG